MGRAPFAIVLLLLSILQPYSSVTSKGRRCAWSCCQWGEVQLCPGRSQHVPSAGECTQQQCLHLPMDPGFAGKRWASKCVKKNEVMQQEPPQGDPSSVC